MQLYPTSSSRKNSQASNSTNQPPRHTRTIMATGETIAACEEPEVEVDDPDPDPVEFEDEDEEVDDSGTPLSQS